MLALATARSPPALHQRAPWQLSSRAETSFYRFYLSLPGTETSQRQQHEPLGAGGAGGAALCRRAAARWWCASLPEHPRSFPLPSPSIPAPFSSSLPEHPCSIPSFLLQHPCSFSPFPPRASLHLPREHPCPWGLCSALGTTLRPPELLSLHPKVILEMKAGRQGQEEQGQQPLSASFSPSGLWSSLSCLPGHPAICISRGRDAFSPSEISYWEPLWKPNSVCMERWPPQPPINCCCQP